MAKSLLIICILFLGGMVKPKKHFIGHAIVEMRNGEMCVIRVIEADARAEAKILFDKNVRDYKKSVNGLYVHDSAYGVFEITNVKIIKTNSK